MENEPITPHTGPTIDADGRLTYVGEDGRRYVVVDGMELDPESSAEVMEALRSAGALFQEIETLCLGWLDLVSASPLGREEAMTLLLATLETVLEASGEHDSAHDDDGDAVSDIDIDSDLEADTNSNADTESDADTESEADTNSDSDTEVDVDADDQASDGG